jgi:hypothetical protein
VCYLEGAIGVSFVLSVQIVSDLYETFCSLVIHGRGLVTKPTTTKFYLLQRLLVQGGVYPFLDMPS